MANYALSELAVAYAEGPRERAEAALVALGTVSRRIEAVMGSGHPLALQVTASVAAAELALARERAAARPTAPGLVPWSFSGLAVDLAADDPLISFRETSSRVAQAEALNNLGLALQKAGRAEEAITAHQDAAALYRKAGDGPPEPRR